MIIEKQPQINKLSIKRFIIFSFAIYPLWLVSYIHREELINLLKSEHLFILIIFLFFAVINWLFGQKNLAFPIMIISNILGYFYFVFTVNVTSGEIFLFMIAALIIYPLFFIIALIAQFTTWIPFLLHFIYQNRKNLNNLTWD